MSGTHAMPGSVSGTNMGRLANRPPAPQVPTVPGGSVQGQPQNMPAMIGSGPPSAGPQQGPTLQDIIGMFEGNRMARRPNSPTMPVPGGVNQTFEQPGMMPYGPGAGYGQRMGNRLRRFQRGM